MADKTEAPTARKLRDAREEGNVPRSQELNSAAALLVGGYLFSGPGRKLVDDLKNLLVDALTSLPKTEPTFESLTSMVGNNLLRLGSDVGIIMGVLLFAGVAITLTQTKFLISAKRIKFDLSRLNPIKGLKARLFSVAGLIEFAKALIKLGVVGWGAYTYIRAHTSELLGLVQTDFLSSIQFWVSIAMGMVQRIASVYLLVALADYAYQRWHYNKTMKMSKQEVRDDHKKSEGDPMLKNRIRSFQRRMARTRMMANVPKADVVITNPTHLAIAVQYNQQAMTAPRVLAKGAHLVAERIVTLARDNNIPVVQNIPLARAIYRTVDIDQEIPPELYVAMAEVLAYVYRLRGRVPAPQTSRA